MKHLKIIGAWENLCAIEDNDVEAIAGGYVVKRQNYGVLASLERSSVRYGSLSVIGYGTTDLTKSEYESAEVIAKAAFSKRTESWRNEKAAIVHYLIGNPDFDV